MALQGELQDSDGCLGAQHLTKRRAVRRWHLHGLLDRGEDEALAAELEERSMPAFLRRRPIAAARPRSSCRPEDTSRLRARFQSMRNTSLEPRWAR